MIAIVDYGMGNLRSVQKALQNVGSDATIIQHPEQIDAAEKIILPGVGAFEDAIAHVRDRGLDVPLLRFIDAGRPFLGICLGLQMLFDVSEENGEHAGLGVLPGRCVLFDPSDPTLKVPHMGWNTLTFDPADGNPLFAGLEPGCHVYFVHSYYARPREDEDIAATTDYDGPFCSAARRGNVFATQFHPEKSQRVGQVMLSNFAKL
ncbi:MAG: imidazole glycerol phosphate synthase subunit HisH [Phycisphaera sp.]|nr:imidazole glycerol phosphate synthase subunit HisH [Phycisphaera sp.]